MQKRNRQPQTLPLIERLERERNVLEAEAARAEPGPPRDRVIKKLRQIDAAAHIDQWLSSPGLRSPQ